MVVLYFASRTPWPWTSVSGTTPPLASVVYVLMIVFPAVTLIMSCMRSCDLYHVGPFGMVLYAPPFFLQCYRNLFYSPPRVSDAKAQKSCRLTYLWCLFKHFFRSIFHSLHSYVAPFMWSGKPIVISLPYCSSCFLKERMPSLTLSSVHKATFFIIYICVSMSSLHYDSIAVK
jgi:hypothetical protein